MKFDRPRPVKQELVSEYRHHPDTMFSSNGYVSCPMGKHGSFHKQLKWEVCPAFEATHMSRPDGSSPLELTPEIKNWLITWERVNQEFYPWHAREYSEQGGYVPEEILSLIMPPKSTALVVVA